MISAYYLNWQDYSERADERETGYPELSYLLVPRRVVLESNPDLPRASTGQVTNLRLDPNISSDEIEDLVEAVKASEISRYVPGELNFARFVQAMMGGIQNDAEALVKALDDYSSSLEN